MARPLLLCSRDTSFDDGEREREGFEIGQSGDDLYTGTVSPVFEVTRGGGGCLSGRGLINCKLGEWRVC